MPTKFHRGVTVTLDVTPDDFFFNRQIAGSLVGVVFSASNGAAIDVTIGVGGISVRLAALDHDLNWFAQRRAEIRQVIADIISIKPVVRD